MGNPSGLNIFLNLWECDVLILGAHSSPCKGEALGLYHLPSPSAADRALSSFIDLAGWMADPAARAPSTEAAVDIWLRAARWGKNTDHGGQVC